ncbi:MAG TPA: hypothetical protein VNM68_03665, partial [Candidatus Polarisedimenticolia bacterium]|nr:hypothetical protein [Candidatus Polarisedimenticolia bacterium]
MMIRMTGRQRLGFCASLMLAMAGAAAGTTLARMTLAEMAQAAPVIVRARCLTNSVRWDAGEIWTLTAFQVEEVWKGVAPARVTVRLLGGRSGNITSRVSGVPRFRAGDDVVLFLEPTARGDFSVVSWEQGTFRIRRGRAVGRDSVTQDTASFATFDPAARRFEATGIRNLPLENFRAQVEAALESETR